MLFALRFPPVMFRSGFIRCLEKISSSPTVELGTVPSRVTTQRYACCVTLSLKVTIEFSCRKAEKYV